MNTENNNFKNLFDLEICRDNNCRFYQVVGELSNTAKKESIADKDYPSNRLDELAENFNRYVCKRALEVDALSFTQDKSKAFYNTRLVDKNNNSIYGEFSLKGCLCTRQNRYCLVGFERTQDLQRKKIPPPPGVDFANILPLYFNQNWKIELNFDHLLDCQHKKRLPEWLMNESDQTIKCYYQEAVQRLRNPNKCEVLPGKSWYNGKQHLLLPINFSDNDLSKAHLALVIDQHTEGVYRGVTVLKLEWAYAHSRIFGPVKAKWLKYFI